MLLLIGVPVATPYTLQKTPKIRYSKRVGRSNSHPLASYCVSRLIQFLNGCYRIYIYPKHPKINTFQKGRCTHAKAATVFRIEITSLSIFLSIKNNDSPFLRVAIVIFCTQQIVIFFQSSL